MQEKSAQKERFKQIVADVMHATGLNQGELAKKLGVGENYLSRIKTDDKFEVPEKLFSKLERFASDSPDIDLLPWPDEASRILAHDWARKCNLHVHAFAVKCVEKFGEGFAEDLSKKLKKAVNSKKPSDAGKALGTLDDADRSPDQ